MPFKTAKQRRWMYANKPALARKWSAKYYQEGGKVNANKILIQDPRWSAIKDLTPAVTGAVKGFEDLLNLPGVLGEFIAKKRGKEHTNERIDITPDALIKANEDALALAIEILSEHPQYRDDADAAAEEAIKLFKNTELAGSLADPFIVLKAPKVLKTLAKYDIEVDPSSLGSTLGNVKIVKRGAKATPVPSFYVKNADGNIEDLSNKYTWSEIEEIFGLTKANRKNKKGPLPQGGRWSFDKDSLEVKQGRPSVDKPEVEFETGIPSLKTKGEKAVRLPRSLTQQQREAIRKDVDDAVYPHFNKAIDDVQEADPNVFWDGGSLNREGSGFGVDDIDFDDVAESVSIDNKLQHRISKQVSDAAWPDVERALDKYKELGPEAYNAIRKYARQQSTYLFDFTKEAKDWKPKGTDGTDYIAPPPQVAYHKGIDYRRGVRSGEIKESLYGKKLENQLDAIAKKARAKMDEIEANPSAYTVDDYLKAGEGTIGHNTSLMADFKRRAEIRRQAAKIYPNDFVEVGDGLNSDIIRKGTPQHEEYLKRKAYEQTEEGKAAIARRKANLVQINPVRRKRPNPLIDTN